MPANQNERIIKQVGRIFYNLPHLILQVSSLSDCDFFYDVLIRYPLWRMPLTVPDVRDLGRARWTCSLLPTEVRVLRLNTSLLPLKTTFSKCEYSTVNQGRPNYNFTAFITLINFYHLPKAMGFFLYKWPLILKFLLFQSPKFSSHTPQSSPSFSVFYFSLCGSLPPSYLCYTTMVLVSRTTVHTVWPSLCPTLTKGPCFFIFIF